MTKLTRKITCVLLFVTMTFTFAFGTGSEETFSSDETVALSVVVNGPLNFDVETDPSLIVAEWDTGLEIEIVNWGFQEMLAKLQTAFASGDVPDIVHIDHGMQHLVQEWAHNGYFALLDDHVTYERFPYIYRVITSDAFFPLRVDGMAYVIPGTHHGNRSNLYFREDWLRAMGRGVPFEELPYDTDLLYESLRMVTRDDPDGNGENDTVGLVAYAGRSGVDGFEPIFRAFGASTGFRRDLDVVNGTVVSSARSRGTLEALRYCNRLYNEGLVNHDYFEYPDRGSALEEWLYANRAGAFYGLLSDTYVLEDSDGDAGNRLVSRVSDYNATFVPAKPPVVANGYRLNGYGVMFSGLIGVFSGSEYVEDALGLIEFANSFRGRQLFVAGVEGRHWSNFDEDSGLYDLDFEQWEVDYWQSAYRGTSWPRWWGFFTNTHGYIPTEKYVSFEDAVKNVVMFGVRADYLRGIGSKWEVDAAKPSMIANPLDHVHLTDVGDRKQALDQIARQYFSRIVRADPGDVDRLWQDYIGATEQAGVKEYVAAYQQYYNSIIE